MAARKSRAKSPKGAAKKGARAKDAARAKDPARAKASARAKAPERKRAAADEPPPNSRAYREFVSEAEEILERMREDLADLYDQRATRDEIEPDLVNRIFRSAHSLKGLAGMFGLDGIGELSHHLEDILDGLRLGRIRPDAPAIDLLDEAAGLIATLMGQLEGPSKGETAESLEAVAALVGRIDGAVEAKDESDDELAGLDLDPALLRALTEYEEHRLRENVRRGRHVTMVDATFEIIAFEEGLSELSGAVREVGEVVSTLPSPGDAPESQIRFSLLVATDIDAGQLRERLDLSDANVRAVKQGAASEATPASEAPAAAEAPAAESAPPSPEQPAPAPGAASPPSARIQGDRENAEIESLRSISDTVRVDIRKLDELMNLVGELIVQRNAIANVAGNLASDPATARTGMELAKTNKLLDRKLKELQAGVLDVRMVPLRQIFEKLSRVVRRLRRDHEKNVTLNFKGADTELDKLIVEQLVDPLMHVVRNAFDHAVETADERLATGKDAECEILIQAFQRGNHVVIEVVDDGRGIDPERVRAKAEERDLVTPDQVLTQKETLDLVFAPGLSTREEVSELSGRGVGMDVVRQNLADLGGMVELDSSLGEGTTVTMTLPITLAIIQALIVGVGEERFAIPLNSVLETLLVEESEIQSSEGRRMLNLRGDALLLRTLADEFELESGRDDGKQFVVVLGMGDQRLGLVVEQLHGQQDTVIKPIKGPIRNIPGIAGATELGDQGAILVLDVSHLVAEAARRREVA